MQSTRIINIYIISALIAILSAKSYAATQKTIELNKLATHFELTSVSQIKNEIIWKTIDSKMVFHPGSRRITFNGTIFWMNSSICKKGAIWTVSGTDVKTVITPLLVPKRFSKKNPRRIVVLDPGHGGKDSGGIGCYNTYEKKVVLEIAQLVKRKLKNSNITVHMTRDSDKFIELYQRPRLAINTKADLFISIHANKASRVGANGIETFVMTASGFASTASSIADNKSYPGNNNNIYNTILANMIHSELLAKTGATDRGVKHARFKVLKDATCPATLVEVGFLTNSAEAKKLITPAYLDKIADGIAAGIRTYLAL
jgi:N-acetylmuramoyl-L-alanine amidase